MDRSNKAFRLLGASLYIGLCIFIGVAGGAWLDNRFNTQPVFVLLGLVLGLVAAFWGFYRMLVPILKDKPDTKEDGKKREKRG